MHKASQLWADWTVGAGKLRSNNYFLKLMQVAEAAAAEEAKAEAAATAPAEGEAEAAATAPAEEAKA